jgi:hypothetical protein
LFVVAVNRNMHWSLGFAHSQWALGSGEVIPVSFVFDGGARINLKATAMGKTMVAVPMPDTSELVTAFRRAYTLQAFARGEEFQFRLDGTSRLLPVLVDCVRRNLESTGQQTASPPIATTPKTLANMKDYQELSQAEATVMLTNLLNSAGVSGYRLVPPTQSSFGAHFSLSDGTQGFFAGARGSTKSADEYATYWIGILSELCKGELVTGRQSVAATDGSVIRRIVSTCKVSDSVSITESTVIRRPNGFLMNLSQTLPVTVSALNEGRGGKDRQAIIDAALRLP